jgi:hypothetical protein
MSCTYSFFQQRRNIVATKITKYTCDVCVAVYDSMEEAEDCEKKGYDYMGDRIYDEGDDIWFGAFDDSGFITDTRAKVLRAFPENKSHRIAYIVRLREPMEQESVDSYDKHMGEYNPYVHGAVGIVRYFDSGVLEKNKYYCLPADYNLRPSILMDYPRDLLGPTK